MGVDSHFALVGAVLAVLGTGIGFFTPANQKVAFASVAKEDYGVLAAMLSSFGTAAGTIGTTIAVALMEMSGGGDTLEISSGVCWSAAICICLVWCRLG